MEGAARLPASIASFVSLERLKIAGNRLGRFDLPDVPERGQARKFVPDVFRSIGDDLFGNPLRIFVVGTNDCLHIEHGAPVLPRIVLHLRDCRPNNFLCSSLVSICFRNSVTNAEAPRPLNGLARRELDERSHCSAFQPYVRNPKSPIRPIEMDEEVPVKNSASQPFNLYFPIEHRPLKILQRV